MSIRSGLPLWTTSAPGHVIGAMALVAAARRPRADACFESKGSDESTSGFEPGRSSSAGGRSPRFGTELP